MSTEIPVPNLPVRDEDKALIKSINAFVHAYMAQPGHDNSHDYFHILRVVSNAKTLLGEEMKENPDQKYDTSALFLAALLHDVGDHKYAKPGEDTENQIYRIMREHGAHDLMAFKVQAIAKHVSWTNEMRDPQSVADTLAEFPELAIVQDADRLDAIGAVGIARCFAYGGARRMDLPMSACFDIYDVKLYKLPGTMKTRTGREIAISRKNTLETFRRQFEEESRLSFGYT